MPLYSYKCISCGRRHQAFRAIAERNLAPECVCSSHAVVEKILDAPAVRGDYEGYSCPVTGKWVEGRKAHQENLARQGCRVLETGEKEQMLVRKAREEAEFDHMIEESAAQTFEALPTEKKEAIAIGLQHGLDVQVTRQGV